MKISIPDGQVDTYNIEFTYQYFSVDKEDFKKNITSTGPISRLTLASSNIRSMSNNFEKFQMDFSKLNFYILGLSETHHSSDIEVLHHVPSSDLFTSNHKTLGGGGLLYVRITSDSIFFSL